MSSIIEGYHYDIFISYRQKDNKGDRWVSEFVEALKIELESTFKEEISVYFDINPHDGLLETHDVDASLKDKLKCLVFIPIISRTYCDPKSFAWEHEFKAFVELASHDQFGLKVKLPNGNVASRVLPVRIYDLDNTDIRLCESILGGVLRGVEFIYSEPGVNRPLKPDDDEKINLNKTKYRNQINKVGNAIKEIIQGLSTQPAQEVQEKDQPKESIKEVRKEEKRIDFERPAKSGKLKLFSTFAIVAILIVAGLLLYPKIFKRDTLEKLRSSGERISVAVMPFQNMTNDTLWNVWQDGIQEILINSFSNFEELKVVQSESINTLIQSKGLTNYASLTPSLAGTISEKLDANVFIYGNIIQAGPTVRLYAKLIYSKTGEVSKSFQVEGPSKEDVILPMIDSLSMTIKNFLMISKLGKELLPDIRSWASTNSPEAYRYFILGNNAFYKRDYSTSIDWCTQAINIDSNFTFAIVRLSLSYWNEGLYDLSKKWCLRIYDKRDLMPTHLKILTNYLYTVNFETPQQTIKCIRLLLEIDDQSPYFFHILGWSYYRLNQYDNAIPEFKKALAIYDKWDSKPVLDYTYIFLGIAYHKEGQYDKEKELYKKAEQDFPDNLNLIYRQAILSLTEADTVAANDYIKKYISLRKEQPSSEAEIKESLADIYSGAGILDKAEEYYEEALSLEPENPVRLNNLAYFLIDKDRNINEGLEFIEKVLELSPDNYEYLAAKGWGLYKQGKYKEALEILQKSWDLRMEKAVYNHDAFLHLEAAKKAANQQK